MRCTIRGELMSTHAMSNAFICFALSVDMVLHANRGHPGLPLGAAV